MKKKTNKEFIEEIIERSFEALEEYTGNKVKILFRCAVCYHEWSARPDSILSGHGCPGCQSVNKILEHYDDNTVLIDISTEKYPLAVSLMDLDRLVEIKGRISLGNHGYPVTKIDGKMRLLHQLVMPECPEGKEIDHIDRNKRNNCISNLRYVSHQENMSNKSKYANNTSGVPGVSWHKDRKKWIARVTINGIQKHLGCFTSLQDATIARKYAEALLEGAEAIEALLLDL